MTNQPAGGLEPGRAVPAGKAMGAVQCGLGLNGALPVICAAPTIQLSAIALMAAGAR